MRLQRLDAGRHATHVHRPERKLDWATRLTAIDAFRGVRGSRPAPFAERLLGWLGGCWRGYCQDQRVSQQLNFRRARGHPEPPDR
eukprot:SAG31_NODE_20079_length_584_cov_0.969072_1_plen_84_part_10